MTFLNGTLVFGAAAFAIPLLIHLLNRSRYRTLPWGAMHLLETVIRVNNRRIRLEQIILLLIRCAIPILLAGCLARPVLTGWRALPGDVPSAAVILLDNSYSMDARSGDRTRFAAAVDDVCRVVDALHKGSEVSVIKTGGGPQPVLDNPIFDPPTMSRQVRALQGGLGASEAEKSLQQGLATLSATSHVRRDLVIVSDFQRVDWESISATSLDRIRRQLTSLPLRPNLTLVQLGPEIEQNVAVESLKFSRTALGVGQDLQLRATLRNFGARKYPGLRVALHVDGSQQSVTHVSLGPNATAQTLFTHRFKTPGSHVFEVEAIVDDELVTDNRFAAAINVLDKIEVLLVDGAPSSQPLEGETDFLAVALTPYTFGRSKLSDLIQTRTVTIGKMDREAVARARVVVLANVSRLSDRQVELLTEYVGGGGSLLIFAGNKLDINWYNQELWSAAGGILPLQIIGLGQPSATQGTATRIVAQHFDHPALQVFNNRANGNLADAEIRQWYRFDVKDSAAQPGREGTSSATSAAPPVVVASLETADPLIVEQRFGEGLVIQVATSCDADWSNLPMRPVYLPLMQQLITTMATRVTPPCNLRAGDPLVAMWPDDSHTAPLTLTTPTGSRRTLQPAIRGTNSVYQFAETQRPGVYTLSGPDGRAHRFAVEAPRTESDPRLLDSDRLQAIAKELGAVVVRSGREYLELDRTRRHGREIWRFVFLALLGLLFVELWLQQRFSGARR